MSDPPGYQLSILIIGWDFFTNFLLLRIIYTSKVCFTLAWLYMGNWMQSWNFHQWLAENYSNQYTCNNILNNTPGTAGGPGGRDRTLAIKSWKNAKKTVFFCKKKNYLNFFCIYIVMPKYWGKQIFTHRRFLKVDQKQKTERKKEKKKSERW